MLTNTQKNIEITRSKDEQLFFTYINDIHSSWIEGLPHGGLLNKLRKSPSNHAQKIVAKIIFKNLHIPKSNSPKQEEYIEEINRLNQRDLKLLVMKAGVIQLSGKIKQIIKAKDIKNIRDSLGDNLYDFTIYKASPLYPLTSAHKTYISVNSCMLTNVINSGYHSLFTILKNEHCISIHKLPKKWYQEHISNYKQHQIEKDELFFHTTLIKNILHSNNTN